MTTLCACREQCGRPATNNGYSDACAKRWRRAGRPVDGPPPPARGNWGDAARAASAASRGVAMPEGCTDPYDELWARGAPERRVNRVRPVAADLARCVAMSDAEGIRRLLCKVTDWEALVVVLAECADPGRVAEVCGAAREGRAA